MVSGALGRGWKGINLIDMLKRIALFLSQRPFVLFVAVSFWLCLEYVILGPYSYVRVGDNLDIFIPRLASLWDGFSVVGIANWSALFAGGIDRLANDMVYPNVGGALFAVFPAWLAYGLVLMVGAFCAGWFTFLLCERRLGLGRVASMVGGVIAAYGLMKVDIMPYILGFGALPAALYYLDRWCATRFSWKTAISAFALGAGFALFSSVPFTLPFTLVMVAVWTFFIRRYWSWRAVAFLCLFGLGAVAPHIPEILSLARNAPLSNRGGDYYQEPWSYSISIIRWLIGYHWIALAVVLVGLFVGLRERVWRGLVIVSALLLFIAPLYQPFATIFGHYFLFVRDFGFDRFYYILPLVLGIAVGIVLDRLEGSVVVRERTLPLRRVCAFAIILLVIAGTFSMKAANARTWFRDGSFYTNTHSPDLASIRSPDEPFRLAVIADERTGLRPASVNMNGFESIGGDTNIISKRYGEFFKEMAMHPRVEPKHSLYFLWQATPEEREQFGEDATAFLNPALLSLANVRYLVSPFPMTLTGFRLVSGALPENYDARSIRAKISENFHGRRVLVYENQDAFPRVFFAQNIRMFSDASSLLDALGTASTTTLKNTVFAEVEDADSLSVVEATIKEAAIISYASDEIVVSTRLDAPSILVLTNNYNPAWHVYADGVEKKVIPADHTFMAVILERETREVVWRYEP